MTNVDDPEVNGEGAVGRNLPPIHRLKAPEMEHMSTRIRWYHALGYTVGEIHKFLGVRYQQVRNIVTTTPKRAAREDVPALVIQLWEVDDDLEAMDKFHLEAEMAAQRAEHRGERRALNKARRAEEDAEAQFGNASLDDEDYEGRGA